MNNLRIKIYDVVQVGDNDCKAATLYDWFMMVIIILSLVPLVFKEVTPTLRYLDIIPAIIFTIDYALRFSVADLTLRKKGPKAFIKYPFTPMAIIDLISILPAVVPLNSGFKLLRLFRLLRTLRVFRAFKLFRYSKNIEIIKNVIKSQRDALICVAVLTLAYVTITALIIFNIEPQSFDDFFDAFYWSVISITTIGYGDMTPITTEGRIITIISAIIGIAVIALPAGIVTAGYMDELQQIREDEE